MTFNEDDSSVATNTNDYMYLIKCKEKIVELEVMDQDILYNADGEIDCPLDVVLHKNGYTLSDLMAWEAKEIQFVEQNGDELLTIKRISLNVNL